MVIVGSIVHPLQDCVRIYQALQRIPTLLKGLSDHNGSHALLLATLFVHPLKVPGVFTASTGLCVILVCTNVLVCVYVVVCMYLLGVCLYM